MPVPSPHEQFTDSEATLKQAVETQARGARAWLRAIARGARARLALTLCHLAIFRKWLPNMGMFFSASTLEDA